MAPDSSQLGLQIVWLFVLAIPIACVVRSVVFEEIFSQPREWMERKADAAPHFWQQKFFYLFTCEYCFSHYVTLFFMFLTRYKLLMDDWRGYLIALFALVLVANAYLNIYARLRLNLTKEKATIKTIEKNSRENP
jgi:hypothetical protein